MKKDNIDTNEDMMLDDLIRACLSNIEEPQEDETEHEWSDGFEDRIKALIMDADNIINNDKIKAADIEAAEVKNIDTMEGCVTELSFWRRNKRALVNAASLLIVFGIGFYGMKSTGLFGTARAKTEAAPEMAAAVSEEIPEEISAYGLEEEAPSLNGLDRPMLKAAPANIAEADNGKSLISDEIEKNTGLKADIDESILDASDLGYEYTEDGILQIKYFSNQLGTEVMINIYQSDIDTSESYSFEKSGNIISITFADNNIEEELKSSEIEKWKSFIK